ncbi:MAG: bifunctional UDP-sugar hydrolase/5'-nucleotidase [Schaedlerella sp.]|nr:bifunctional UDP-sugar hydrolase/5'-nucleotidase [Schaedlerella sp.]
MERYKKLTILHSNDMHGDFLTEKDGDRFVGGVSLLSGYVSKVREEEPNTLYCIAGDMFRGSVIDSEFQGISTIEIMNAIAPNVVALGNHEVDYGIGHLLFLEKCAKFPIINANMYIRTNHARLFQSHIIENVDGMKILFIGVLTEDVLSQTKADGLVGSLVDIEDAVGEIGRICNAYNAIDIDFTIILTHIGFEEDKKLASKLDPAWGVDVIVGGHSHTYIEKPEKVNDILIVQAGTGTDQIGRFDIIVNTDYNCVEEYTWQMVSVDDKNCPRDLELEKLIERFKKHTDYKYNRLVTHMRKQLTHRSRQEGTEIGGLFTDILQGCLGVDIVLIGSGSIRNEELGPMVLYSDLVECFPYDGKVYMLTVSGEQLYRMMEYVFRAEVWQGIHSEFFQISKDFRIIYNKRNNSLVEITYRGFEIEKERFYVIGIEDYHYINFEKNFGMQISEIEKNGKGKIIATSCMEILDEYLSSHQHLIYENDGRITILE